MPQVAAIHQRRSTAGTGRPPRRWPGSAALTLHTHPHGARPVFPPDFPCRRSGSLVPVYTEETPARGTQTPGATFLHAHDTIVAADSQGQPPTESIAA